MISGVTAPRVSACSSLEKPFGTDLIQGIKAKEGEEVQDQKVPYRSVIHPQHTRARNPGWAFFFFLKHEPVAEDITHPTLL